jgi:hypothetical protein
VSSDHTFTTSTNPCDRAVSGRAGAAARLPLEERRPSGSGGLVLQLGHPAQLRIAVGELGCEAVVLGAESSDLELERPYRPAQANYLVAQSTVGNIADVAE